MIRLSFSLLFILLCKTAEAQDGLVIAGSTQVTNQMPLPNASLVCKNKAGEIIAYTYSNSQGRYQMIVPANNVTFKVIASAVGYGSDSITVSFQQLDKIYKHDFLLRPVVINLKEINISVNNLPVVVKKDTTTFKVSSFIDGTERVVEDVLKKLPGIDVSENGDLKFKGKKIDEVQFEGDDILGSNYKLGTKNLSAMTIDKVEAIENYSNTTLLQGIKKGNKTILNLQLKDDYKKPTSLNADASLGVKYKYNIAANLISISEKFKGFSIANKNNIGDDPSPYGFFMNEAEGDESLLTNDAAKIISHQIAFPDIKESRYNFNNKILLSPATLYKFSDRFRLRLSGSLASDRNHRSNLANTTYITQLAVFNLVENHMQQIRNTFYAFDADLYFKASPKLELKYASKINHLDEKTTGETALINNNINVYNHLTDREFFHSNRFNLLKRLNNQQALAILATYQTQKIPQVYLLDMDNFFILNPARSNVIQSVNTENTSAEIKATLTGIYKKLNYDFITGAILVNEGLSSALNFEKNSSHNFSNNLWQRQLNYHIGATGLRQFGKFTFTTAVGLHHLKKTLSDHLAATRLESVSPYVAYKLMLSFKPSEKAKLNLFYEYSLTNFGIDNLFTGYILTDYRSLTNNEINFSLPNAQNIGFSYAFNDFIAQQFQFYVLTNYTWHDNSLSSNLNVQQNYILNTKLTLAGSKNLLGLLSISKYLDFISSTIKLNSSVNFSSNTNLINELLKESQVFRIQNELSARTLLGSSITLTLSAKSILFYSKSNLRKNPSVNNLSSYYGITIKPIKQWLITMSAETNWGDVNSSKKSTINLVDMSIVHTISQNKLAVKLLANNVFNQQYYKSTTLNDYQINEMQYQLLPRSIMANVQYRFGK